MADRLCVDIDDTGRRRLRGSKSRRGDDRMMAAMMIRLPRQHRLVLKNGIKTNVTSAVTKKDITNGIRHIHIHLTLRTMPHAIPRGAHVQRRMMRF